jgi:hypothetical protein
MNFCMGGILRRWSAFAPTADEVVRDTESLVNIGLENCFPTAGPRAGIGPQQSFADPKMY